MSTFYEDFDKHFELELKNFLSKLHSSFFSFFFFFSVWELKFHRSYPNHLFTCSQDGAVWHWDATANATQIPIQRPDSIRQRPSSVRGQPDSSPWLSGAVSQGKVDVRNYLPHNKLSVNAVDIESRHLVCGTDSEAICIIPNLVIR